MTLEHELARTQAVGRHRHSSSLFPLGSCPSPLLLITGGVVLLVFPWLTPLILQLAPVGSVQPLPLLSAVLRGGPHSCAAPQNITRVMRSSILIEGTGVIKAGLILLWIITHTRLVCRVCETFRFLSGFFSTFFLFRLSHFPSLGCLWYLSPSAYVLSLGRDVDHKKKREENTRI